METRIPLPRREPKKHGRIALGIAVASLIVASLSAPSLAEGGDHELRGAFLFAALHLVLCGPMAAFYLSLHREVHVVGGQLILTRSRLGSTRRRGLPFDPHGVITMTATEESNGRPVGTITVYRAHYSHPSGSLELEWSSDRSFVRSVCLRVARALDLPFADPLTRCARARASAR